MPEARLETSETVGVALGAVKLSEVGIAPLIDSLVGMAGVSERLCAVLGAVKKPEGEPALIDTPVEAAKVSEVCVETANANPVELGISEKDEVWLLTAGSSDANWVELGTTVGDAITSVTAEVDTKSTPEVALRISEVNDEICVDPSKATLEEMSVATEVGSTTFELLCATELKTDVADAMGLWLSVVGSSSTLEEMIPEKDVGSTTSESLCVAELKTDVADAIGLRLSEVGISLTLGVANGWLPPVCTEVTGAVPDT
jgi:hypothetical protein